MRHVQIDADEVLWPGAIPVFRTSPENHHPFLLARNCFIKNCTFESNWTSDLLVVNVNSLCEGLGYLCQSKQLPPSLVHHLAEPLLCPDFHVPFVITDLQTIIHQIAHTDPTKPFTIEPHLLCLSQCNYYRSLGFRDRLLLTKFMILIWKGENLP